MDKYIIEKKVTETSSFFVLQNSHGDEIALNLSLSNNLTTVNHDLVAIDLVPIKEGVQPKEDKVLGQVIGRILRDYMLENPTTVLYFIPMDVDNRAQVRMRKFNSWYQEFNNTYNIYQERIVETDDNGKVNENGVDFYLGCFYPQTLSEQEIQNYVRSEILHETELNK